MDEGGDDAERLAVLGAGDFEKLALFTADFDGLEAGLGGGVIERRLARPAGATC